MKQSTLIDPDDVLVDTAFFSEYIHRAKGTIANWRGDGYGPPYVKLEPHRGGGVRYRFGDIRKWVEDRLRNSTTDPGSDPEFTQNQAPQMQNTKSRKQSGAERGA